MNASIGPLLFWAAVLFVGSVVLLTMAAIGGIRKTFGPFWHKPVERHQDEQQ